MNRTEGHEEVEMVFSQVPDLEKGINFLEGGQKSLHRVIGQEIRYSDSKAVWIDSGSNSSTYSLSNYAGADIDRIRMGRAFTPHQHYTLVKQVEEDIQDDTEVLVLPEITSLYLKGQVREWEAEELFEEVWDEIQRLQKKYSLKVVVSASGDSLLDFQVKQDSDHVLKVDETSQGEKFSSRSYIQRAYAVPDGFQTTLSYWRDKISAERKVSPRVV